MSNHVIDQRQMEASVVYDAFMRSVALPTIYGQASVDLVVEELELQLERSRQTMEPEEVEFVEAYMLYLSKVKYDGSLEKETAKEKKLRLEQIQKSLEKDVDLLK